MLYFQSKPDLVFQTILHQALKSELQEVTRISTEKDFGAWEAGFGNICATFTPYCALITIEQLLIASHQYGIYRMSDFHWLLIYECLKNYCAIHHDMRSHKEGHSLTITEYRLREIDFQEMVDLYFWDTDFIFLSAKGHLQKLDFNLSSLETPSTAALTHDLQPHPRYLKLTPVKEPMWRLPEPQDDFDHDSHHSPDFT